MILQIHVQYVGGAPSRVMQVCAQAQKKVVRTLDSALVAFAQPVFPDQLVCAQRTLFEVGNPKEILIIAQSATAALQVGLLQVNAVAEFFVPDDLILHAQLDIVAFVSDDAFRTKLFPKFSRQISVASEKPRLQHGSFCAHIAVGLRNGFFDRTRRVSDFESAIPQQVQDLVYHVLQIR